MAITLGTDSYSTIAEANAYLALDDRAIPDDTYGENLLKRATQAIDRIYGHRFIGQRTSTNPLHWPRDLAAYSNTNRYLEKIPTELKQATAEMAVLIDSGIDPYEQPTPASRDESVSVDAISVSSTYVAPFTEKPLYKVELILKPLLTSQHGLRLYK